MDLKKLQQDRFKFLLNVYESVKGNSSYMVDMWEVGQEIGLDPDEVYSVFLYLEGEGLVESRAMGGGMSITHAGVKEIEQSFSKPDIPTEHFLPYNQYTINIGTMSGGAIQQAVQNSTINIVSNDISSQIELLIADLKQHIDTSRISDERKEELKADILTIEHQNKSPRPKKEILKSALISIKGVLVGLATGIAANISTPAVQIYIHKIELLINSL